MFQLEQVYQRSQNSLMSRAIEKADIENATAELGRRAEELRLHNLPKMLQAELALKFAEIETQKSAAGLNYQQIKKVKADTAKSWLEAYGFKISNDTAERLSDFTVGSAAMDFLAPYEDYYGVNRHYNRVGKVIGGIGTLFGVGAGLLLNRARKGLPKLQVGNTRQTGEYEFTSTYK